MQPTKREQELTDKINVLLKRIDEIKEPTSKILRDLQDEKNRLTRIRCVYRRRREKKLQKDVAI